MVRGLDLFKECFKDYTDQYVLIGGSACYILFSDAGQEFRATKDLDIVLCLEALTHNFFVALVEFILKGNYELKEKGSGDKILYRYSKPRDTSYPYQIELFSAKPMGVELPDESTYTPIKIDDEYISLSALLLNDDYYNLILQGKTIINEISVLKPEFIMMFKAKAWLDLSDKRATGVNVDSGNIKKHIDDVFRLLALLSKEMRVSLASSIQDDMQLFISRCSDVVLNDFARFRLGMDQKDALKMIETIFEL